MVGRGAGKTELSVVLCIGKSWLGLVSPKRGRDGLGRVSLVLVVLQ